MCTRKQAIKLVVTSKRGSIKTLRDSIGSFYDKFLMLGIIKEILPDPDNDSEKSENWEATEVAIENATLFGIDI